MVSDGYVQFCWLFISNYSSKVYLLILFCLCLGFVSPASMYRKYQSSDSDSAFTFILLFFPYIFCNLNTCTVFLIFSISVLSHSAHPADECCDISACGYFCSIYMTWIKIFSYCKTRISSIYSRSMFSFSFFRILVKMEGRLDPGMQTWIAELKRKLKCV